MMPILGDSNCGAEPDANSAFALFDTWLQTSLQQRYDRTLDEPVPEELLDLVPRPADSPQD